MGGTGFAAIIHHLFCVQCCLPALRLQCYQGYTDYMGCEETERRSAINLCHYTLIWKAGEHRATSHVYHISFYWKKEGYRSCLLFIVLEKRGLQVMFTFHCAGEKRATGHVYHISSYCLPGEKRATGHVYHISSYCLPSCNIQCMGLDHFGFHSLGAHTHTTHTAFLMQAEKGH